MSSTLESRIDFIREQIKAGEFTAPARECTVIIENSFRELYRRGIGLLSGADRVKVNQAEAQIGSGNKTVDDFTLGQLVALFRNSGFLGAWADATGNELRGISMINLDEIVKLRNALTHGSHDTTRQEAELLFQCVQSILETFGILSLESIHSNVDTPSPPAKSVSPSGRLDKRDASAYTPEGTSEGKRLVVQSDYALEFDSRLLQEAVEPLPERPLVVIDLGCGEGSVTLSRFSSDRYGTVIGFDRSEEALKVAASRTSDQQKFHFLSLDFDLEDMEIAVAQKLAELELDGVDLIFSALTFHHLANPIKALRACRYLLGDSGAVVVRTPDDGTLTAWPDPDSNFERIVEMTLSSPGASDRLHGRKLYSQLYRAGFRKILLDYDVLDTAGMSPLERAAIFGTNFSYRSNYLRQATADNPGRKDFQRAYEEMTARLEQLEVDFEDDGFFFSGVRYGAIARIQA